MKKNVALTLFAALSLSLSLIPASGQLPVSRPSGIILKTIKGSNGYTPIGLPFTREPVARAVVSSVAASVATASGTPFAAAGTYTSTPHSVLVVTGANRGVVAAITANTTSSVTFANASTLVAADDELLVVPDWTLGNLFGTGSNPSGLTSNAAIGSADVVYVAAGGSLTQYYHNGTNWRSSASPTNRNNLSLGGLNGGCMVLKRGAGDLTFQVKGTIRSGRSVVSISNGFSLVTYADVAGTTLLNSQLQTGVLTGNASSALADIVYVPNASGGLVQYYWTGTIWRNTSSPTNQGSLAVKPETALLINKRSAGTSSWNINESFTP